jgi:putative spermidine/putrescine transport system substrate-binding protein
MPSAGESLRLRRSRWLTLLLIPVLVGCTPAAPAQPTAGTAAAAGQAAKLEDSLVFAGFGGSTHTSLQKCAIDEFQQKYNVRVDYLEGQGGDNVAKAVAQKNNPTIDVLMLQSADLYRAGQQGVLANTDLAAIPNAAFIGDDFGGPPKYGSGVAVALGVNGIEYNTKVFGERGWAPPTSWNDLWDPRFKGHVALLTITVAATQSFIQVISQLNGGTTANVDPAFKRIAELKPNLFAVFSAAAQLDQGFQQDNVWIATGSGSRTLQLKDSGVGVDMVQPSEGTNANVVYVALGKGAPHPNAGLAFMNWLLESKQQTCLPTDVGLGPVRKDVVTPPNLANYMIPLPTTKVIPLDDGEILKQLDAWVLRWNKEIESQQ